MNPLQMYIKFYFVIINQIKLVYKVSFSHITHIHIFVMRVTLYIAILFFANIYNAIFLIQILAAILD